jgi:hypothetical protein
MALPVPWLLYRCAIVVGAPAGAAGVGSFVPVAWPHLAHVTASVSHASLLLVATAATVLALTMLARGDLRVRIGLAAGLTLSVALLSKGLSLGLGSAVVMAFVAAGTRTGWRESVRPFGALSLGALPGLAWYVANLVRFGQLQPSGWPSGFFDPSEQAPLSPRSLATYLDGVSATMWFNPLEFEIPLPTPVHRLITLGVVGVVVVALVLARDRVAYGILLLAPISAAFLTAYGTFFEPETTATVFAGARGRYLQVAAPALAAAVALLASRVPRWIAAVIPGLAAAVALAAVALTVRHFWRGADLVESLQVSATWWSGGVVLFLSSTLLLVVAGVGGTLVAFRQRSSVTE